MRFSRDLAWAVAIVIVAAVTSMLPRPSSRDVTVDDARPSVDSVGVGMTGDEVRQRLGEPYRVENKPLEGIPHRITYHGQRPLLINPLHEDLNGATVVGTVNDRVRILLGSQLTYGGGVADAQTAGDLCGLRKHWRSSGWEAYSGRNFIVYRRLPGVKGPLGRLDCAYLLSDRPYPSIERELRN